MRCVVFLAVVIFNVVALILPAGAVEIIYEISANGSGVVGNTQFSEKKITINIVADNNNVSPSTLTPNTDFLKSGEYTIEVAGVGKYAVIQTSTNNLSIACNRGSSRINLNKNIVDDSNKLIYRLLEIYDSSFASYDLKSAVPLLATSTVTLYGSNFLNHPIPTDGGNLILTDVHDVQFSAALPATTPVPVMDGWWILPGVVAGGGFLVRRRKE